MLIKLINQIFKFRRLIKIILSYYATLYKVMKTMKNFYTFTSENMKSNVYFISSRMRLIKISNNFHGFYGTRSILFIKSFELHHTCLI